MGTCMVIDQNELDKLVSQANALANEVETATCPLPKPRKPTRQPAVAGDELKRILRLRVPVLVRLAYRNMPLRSARRLAPGAIIEFEKSVNEPLDLLVNNRPVGHGDCVKVGEHFGIRLTDVVDRNSRIRSLGG